jgi:ribosomal protein L4
VRVILADSLNVVDLLDADTLVFTQDALTRAQEVYA